MKILLLTVLFVFAACTQKPVSEVSGEPVFNTKTLEPVTEIVEPKGDYPSDKFLKVAVVQWRQPLSRVTWTKAEAEQYKSQNREYLKTQIEEAVKNGAKIVVLPEFSVTGYPYMPELPPDEVNYRSRDDIKHLVERVPGKSSRFFGELSRKHGIWIQFGIAEEDAKTKEYFNSAVVTGPKGDIVAKYHKQNFYGIEYKFLSKGSKPASFQTPAGKVGVMICADTYSEKVLAQYKQEKVDAVLNSSSWAELNSGMYWFAVAAKEVGAYMVNSNHGYAPDAGVINPDGSIQSHIKQTRNAIAYGYLPLK